MVLNKRLLEKKFSPNKMLKRKVAPQVRAGVKTNVASKVRVYVRVRPFNNTEQICSCRQVVNVVDSSSLIFDPPEFNQPFFFKGVTQKGRDMTRRTNKNLHFQFDRVFDGTATNVEVYEATTKKIVSAVFDGYNCSVFAYGATGAGKTFTMLGTQEQPGIAFLTIVELLRYIETVGADMTVTLGASYLEVYNENVKDLLQPGLTTLHLREDGGQVTVSGLKVHTIVHSEELFSLLAEGNRNRTQHPTDSNAESSRSHAVFQVYVRMEACGQVKISKLSMIDLAGSERGAATGCKGLRFQEGSNINKSLLALGNCINSLADGLKHVPYRDSKLTRILKDSLGGNCQTIMIANISPSSSSFEDTYNTLKYASRAKCIKTTISRNVMNEALTIPQYKKLVEDLKSKISKMEETSVPDISDWKKRLDELFEEKKSLRKELLKLQSQGKLTELRIHLKNRAMSHHNPDNLLPSQDRLGMSIYQLQARAESIRGRIEEFRPRHDLIKKKIEELEKEVEGNSILAPMLHPLVAAHKAAIEVEEQKIGSSHVEKVMKLRAKHEDRLEGVVNGVFPLLNELYLLVRSHGHLTHQLSTKYEETLRSLDGMKGVTWLDEEVTEDEEDSRTKTVDCLLNSPFSQEEGVKSAKSLSTTFLVPSAYTLRENNRAANVPPSPGLISPRPWKAVLKSRPLGGKPRTPITNKENVKTENLSVGKIKSLNSVGSSVPRPHPYRRTPLRSRTITTNSTSIKLKAVR